MKSYLGISCVGLLIVFGAFVQGQDLEPESGMAAAPPIGSPQLAIEPGFPGPAAIRSVRYGNDLQKALHEFKSAESDDDKDDAKGKVKTELEKQYDAFLERDQKRIDQLFDRLKKLEAQLEKRKDAKDRLVELKLEMLISQAEGLGWPTDNSGIIYGPSLMPTPVQEPAFYDSGIGIDPSMTLTPSAPIRSVPGLPNRAPRRK